jgi:LmbE family N-acetylglucosaminyl deacetylase
VLFQPPSFTAGSRVLLIAPHPDDESLACSIVLQRAVRAGSSIRVVYATDGENNAWPQRALHRKWRLTEFDRAAWGERRRNETIAALNLVGVVSSNVDFLGLPDQGLTGLLLSGCSRTLNRLAQCITEWAPTDMFWPHIADTHPDHSALGVMLRLISEAMPKTSHNQSIWNFLVHGRSAEFFRQAARIRQSSRETALKLEAINCHKSQLILSRRRFIAYAGRSEFFAPYQSNNSYRRAALNTRRTNDRFVVTVPPISRRRRLSRRPTLLVIGGDSSGKVRSLCLPVDPQGRVSRMFDGTLSECLGTVRSNGTLFSGLQLMLPAIMFASDRSVYVKIDRRGIFFDEAGWVDATEIPHAPAAAEVEIDGELSLAVS